MEPQTLSRNHPKRPGARSLAEQCLWQKLIDYSVEWRSQEPECYLADYYAGIGYNGLALHEVAIRFYLDAVTKDPTDPHVWMNIAVTYQDMGQIKQALPYMKRAVEVQPDYAHTLRAYGNMLGLAQQYREASDCFSRVLDLEPQDKNSLALYLRSMREAQRMPELLDAMPLLKEKYPEQRQMIESAKIAGPLNLGNWSLGNFRISCNCDNNEPLPQSWDYVHHYNGHYISPKIEHVWCVQCGRVTAASKPLDFGRQDALKNKLQETAAKLQKTPRYLSQSFAKKLLGRLVDNPDYLGLQHTLARLQDALLCAALYDEMRRLNQNRPRCLRCCSTETEALLLPSRPETSRTPIGHRCSRCQGQIVWQGDWVCEPRYPAESPIFINPGAGPPTRKYTQLDASGRIERHIELSREVDILYPLEYMD